jgi:hypothetical protein
VLQGELEQFAQRHTVSHRHQDALCGRRGLQRILAGDQDHRDRRQNWVLGLLL